MRSKEIQITPATYAAFVERFTAFGDALIESVSIPSFGHASGKMQIEVVVVAKDSRGGHARVLFSFDGVEALKLCEGPNTTCVVIYELSIEFDAGLIRVNFDCLN